MDFKVCNQGPIQIPQFHLTAGHLVNDASQRYLIFAILALPILLAGHLDT